MKEVCDRAEINRGTFYKHYQDCYDLMNQIEESALLRFEQTLASIDTDGVRTALVSILEVLRDNRPCIRFMADPARGRSFIYRLSGKCLHYMNPRLPQSGTALSELERNASFAFLAGGSSGIIEYWIHGGMKEAPEEIACQIETLCKALADGLIKQD